jgi:hypothetical protein
VRNRPAFIPPSSPAPLLDFTSLRDIGRSLIFLGLGVTRGCITFTQARDLAMQHFLNDIWDGNDIEFAKRVCARVEAALDRHVRWYEDYFDDEEQRHMWDQEDADLDDEARAWEMARAWDGVGDEEVRGR